MGTLLLPCLCPILHGAQGLCGTLLRKLDVGVGRIWRRLRFMGSLGIFFFTAVRKAFSWIK